ncbi:hypothetical protein [Actinomadura algeriensis]|uniref:RES domain-containing protein n=1 Tax=Actinomadura algeriensis TaxID=1679523 RepID=A0ABR9JL59_9ACTN|nr:hypothetical protein [Actinomadura algeriensis]MBE1531253.1 hypothetical protein [Actinomadura algeriensis]
MGIVESVLEFADVRPLPGLDRAWTFPGAYNRFQRAVALTEDGRKAFQVLCTTGYSDETAAAILRFARLHETRLWQAAPFAAVPGFALPGNDFDCLASVLPAITDSHADDWERHVFDVFPAWRCEFSLDESESEARHRFRKELDPQNFERRPRPFLRIRYENPRTGLRASESGGRMLADAARWEREVGIIDEAGSGWAEAENHRGQVRRVVWNDGVAELVDPVTREREPFKVADAVEFIGRFSVAGLE